MEKTSSSPGKKSLILAVAILGLLTTIVMAGQTKNSLYRSGLQMLNGRHADDMMYETASEPSIMMEETIGVGSAPSDGMMKMAEPAIGIYPYYPDENALDVDSRVYEKYSDHSLVVDDVSEYMTQIKEYILSIGGRVLSSSVSTNDETRYGSIHAKIPVEKFEESQTRITQNTDKVVSEHFNSQDRTGQAVNTQENLENLRNQKLELEIQLDEAKTDTDKRRIQLQISRLEAQIKNAEAQVNNIEERVEFATVSIQVSDNERFFRPLSTPDIQTEIRSAWESISDVFFLMVRLAIWVTVYALLWLPLVLIFRFFMRRINQRKS